MDLIPSPEMFRGFFYGHFCLLLTRKKCAPILELNSSTLFNIVIVTTENKEHYLLALITQLQKQITELREKFE